MKNKKIKILLITIALLILIAILILVIINNKKKEEKSEKDFIKSRIVELLENNYKYYYYMYGDVNVEEGNIENEDGEIYYIVNDDKLITPEELTNVIEDTFLEEYIANRYNAEGRNEYIEFDGNIYVKKGEKVCKNIVEYDLSNIKYEFVDEKIIAYFGDNSTYIYNDNGIWKQSVNVYYCETEE